MRPGAGRLRAKRWAVAGLFLGGLWSGPARAGEFRPPKIPEGETCEYRVYERAENENQSESFVAPREEVQEVHQIITTFAGDGQEYYRFFRAERLSGGHLNYYTYIFRISQPFRFVAFSKKVESTTGRIVHDEITYFDDPGRPFSEDLNHFYSIPMTIRGMDFPAHEKNDLKIWFSSHFTPWKMDVTVKGKDRVTVPAGTFSCWRVEVTPDLKAIMQRWYWIARILKAWIPSYGYWFSQEAPHLLVKFEGRFGPVGFSPVQVQELVSVGAATEADRELLRRYSPAPEDLHFYPAPKNSSP